MSEQKPIDYTQKVLEVKNLKKYFTVGFGKNKFVNPAVNDVSFDIHKREVFGLVGESGCGKTTTGRTIIKLYEPTDGTVDLNGVRISSGHMSNVVRIKQIKEKTKEDILALNSQKYERFLIKQERDAKISDINFKINDIKYNLKHDVAHAKLEYTDYTKKLYDIKSIYALDVDKIKYAFILASQKINLSTKNPSLVEKKNQLDIAKARFNNKIVGIKESAGLQKETILENIDALKDLYQYEINEINNHFDPLIESDELKKLDKNIAKQQISELKTKRNLELSARKEKYVKELSELVVPDKKEINIKVRNLNNEAKAKLVELVKQIAEIKKEYALKSLQVVAKEETLEEKHLRVQKIEEIKLKSNEEIKIQKDAIRESKAINNSKDSLVASRQMQMIFQDPISSLNPRMTVREIVGEGLTILGTYSKEEIDYKVKNALETVGLAPEYASRYPHEFSGGQRQRIGVARALVMNPNVIIADEPISALDVSIRAQVINLLSDLKNELDLTILFIAHDLSVVRFFCDRIAVMYSGTIVEMAPAEDLFKNPMHPYTQSLLSAIPQPDPDYEKGRKRVNYNPRMHDYRYDRPKLQELAKDHFIFANTKEFAEYSQKYNENNDKNGGN